MNDLVPSSIASIHWFAAGLTFQLGVTHLLRWGSRRTDRVAFWFGLSAASLTAGLLANLWLLAATGSQVESVMVVRTVLLMVILMLAVPTVAAFVNRPVPVRGLTILGSLCLIRLGLWMTTDLVYLHDVGADGAPRYGPLLVPATLPVLAVLTFLVVRLTAHWEDLIERVAFAIGLGAGARSPPRRCSPPAQWPSCTPRRACFQGSPRCRSSRRGAPQRPSGPRGHWSPNRSR